MDETLLEWLQEQDVENTTLAKLLTKYYYTWQKYRNEVTDLLSKRYRNLLFRLHARGR